MKALLHPGCASLLGCSLSSSCSHHQQQSCILSTAFRKGEGNPGLGGDPQNCRRRVQPHVSLPTKEGPSLFLAHATTACSRGDARRWMLGEARSHSSSLLLGAAGDWRRVTSPLPRRGSRASPAIFGSSTSTYRREARAVPPHGLTSRVPPREGERAEPALPAAPAAAETPSPLQGAPPQRGTARWPARRPRCPQHQQAGHWGRMAAV